ncbi:MAG: alpha/beta hydrolase [Anaerolineae bacterium]|nr:alpha/beta hydrolase [Anaerolineae bacterium]
MMTIRRRIRLLRRLIYFYQVTVIFKSRLDKWTKPVARVSLRLFSLLTALFASLILFDSKDGALQGLAWGPKLVASALSPFLAVLGGLFAFWGIKYRDWYSTAAGLLSAGIAINHVRNLTPSHEAEFVQAFGPDWVDQIPPDVRARLRSYRWAPLYRRRRYGALHRDVVFGVNSDSGRPLTADLMQPPPGVPRTGLATIFVHGGGWWYGHKNITKFPFFERLVSQGHVVMDINYTLAPHSSVLGMVKDVKQAILWLKQHAATFEIDPTRIVLTGQSAGAHLSLLAAYTPNDPALQPDGIAGDSAVRGVISYQGPTDMVALYEDTQHRFVRLFPNRLVTEAHRLLELVSGHGSSLAGGIASVMGGTPAEIPDLYRQLSPITYAGAACPPTLLLQGNHDLLVDHRDVERLYQTLRSAQAPVVYIPFPQCNHAFEAVLPRLSPPAQTAAYYTERFLAVLV